MISWPSPFLPVVPGAGGPLRLHDTVSAGLDEIASEGAVTMYVCGITPYDATHLGHAATYVTFDVLVRTLRDAGHDVVYVQNVTDVDDPLLERAQRDGKAWDELAREQTALFAEDMTALQVIAPTYFVGAVESIPLIVKAVEELEANGSAYRLDAPEGGQDVYFDATAQPSFGAVSHLDRQEMLELFTERGGDPERAGKHNALDPVLWRARRAGEPAWPGGALGDGRPGWHIECATIALQHLGMPFDIQGGGTDLVFPHAYSFRDGTMHPGEAPGLGVDIDEVLAQTFPYEPAYLPTARKSDGTVHSW